MEISLSRRAAIITGGSKGIGLAVAARFAASGARWTSAALLTSASHKQDYVGRLEVLLRERMERIDELSGKLDKLRERNRRLDQENEHLAEIAAQPRLQRTG